MLLTAAAWTSFLFTKSGPTRKSYHSEHDLDNQIFGGIIHTSRMEHDLDAVLILINVLSRRTRPRRRYPIFIQKS